MPNYVCDVYLYAVDGTGVYDTSVDPFIQHSSYSGQNRIIAGIYHLGSKYIGNGGGLSFDITITVPSNSYPYYCFFNCYNTTFTLATCMGITITSGTNNNTCVLHGNLITSGKGNGNGTEDIYIQYILL